MQNYGREFSFSCVLAFLSHDAVGQRSISQLMSGLKHREAISQGTCKEEKVRKVGEERRRVVKNQVEKKRVHVCVCACARVSVCVWTQCMFICLTCG